MTLAPNYQQALRIKRSGFTGEFPELTGWNPEKPLRGFQRRGVAYLLAARRALLADQVGLGKTVQTLALRQLLANAGQSARMLVVTVPGKAVTQWVEEVGEYTPGAWAISVTGSIPPMRRREAYSSGWDILVTSYPILLRDWEVLRRLRFDIVVFDEASNLKNSKIKTWRAAQEIARRADRRILLEATPVQTTLVDLYSQLTLLDVGLWPSRRWFEDEYLRYEEFTRYGRKGQRFTDRKLLGYRNVERFKEEVEPFILRRRRTDPEVEVELPPLEVIPEWVTLSIPESKAYAAARDVGRKALKGNQPLAVQTSLASMRVAAAAPKVERLGVLLPDLLEGDGKVVVFAQYLSTIDAICRKLNEIGVEHVRYTGVESQQAKVSSVERFTTGTAQVIVGTSAIERALNLQVARTVVTVDLHYNPQRLVQLYGRIQRIGTKHANLQVINLLAEDTLDEAIERVVRERAAVSDYVFEEASDAFQQLTVRELALILGVDPSEVEDGDYVRSTT